MESIFAIEEAFDIQIPFNVNNPSDSDFNISSVSSIISGIKKLVAENLESGCITGSGTPSAWSPVKETSKYG